MTRTGAHRWPSHCSGIIASLARECAEAWLDLAEQLDRKVADIPSHRRANGS